MGRYNFYSSWILIFGKLSTHPATPIGIWLLITSFIMFYFCISQLKQSKAEIQRLKKENEVVKGKLKTAEVKNQDNIVKLKRIEELEMKLTTKEAELLHLQTVVSDLEKEKISLKNVQKFQSISGNRIYLGISY